VGLYNIDDIHVYTSKENILITVVYFSLQCQYIASIKVQEIEFYAKQSSREFFAGFSSVGRIVEPRLLLVLFIVLNLLRVKPVS
jgi:hypothetical protein